MENYIITKKGIELCDSQNKDTDWMYSDRFNNVAFSPLDDQILYLLNVALYGRTEFNFNAPGHRSELVIAVVNEKVLNACFKGKFYEEALNYCIEHHFLRVLNNDDYASLLIKKTSNWHDEELAINFVRYIKIAFGTDSTEDVDRLYEYFDKKLKFLLNNPNHEFVIDAIGEGHEGEILTLYNTFVAFNRQHGKKIACDYVMTRLHDSFGVKPLIDKNGEQIKDVGSFLKWYFAPDDTTYALFILEALHDDVGVWNDIEFLISDVWSGSDDNNEERYFYERNSEHKRKVKTTKKEKQKTVKRHIFRKNVIG